MLEKALKKKSSSVIEKTQTDGANKPSWQQIKDNLERRTGFHFSIKSNDKVYALIYDIETSNITKIDTSNE